MPAYPLPDLPPGVPMPTWEVVVASVRDYCGWHIAPEITETVTVDGSGTWAQLLPTLRLVDLLSITNAGDVVANPEWSASGVVRGAWTGRYRGVVAEMKHGYATWPSDLLGVMSELATDTGKGRVSQVTNRAYQVSFDLDSETDRQRSILDRYRLQGLS